jgi:Pyruvate/2-oxoacid:ferredoxin oxidoreductase delta subunit
MPEQNLVRRVIEVNEQVITARSPRPMRIAARKRGDFPRVATVHLDAAEKLSSPLLMGPPLCDELVALVQHLFTQEEAAVVRCLGVLSGKSEHAIARTVGRPLDEVVPILHHLAFKKRAIACTGLEGEYRYKLMPLLPGIFEMVLIGESLETLSPWHQRFVELFEAVYDTGYNLDYMEKRDPTVRFLPIAKAIEGNPMALPSDWLGVVLDRYKVFGVGQCQCRMSAATLGAGCGKPLGNCIGMGEFAEKGIRHGWLKPISLQGVLEVKAEAEANGLVSWILNVESTKGQFSCSCCGCCCKGMRLVSQFNAPGLMAPPHFVPRFDTAQCSHCGKCVMKCPMGALTVDRLNKTLSLKAERCIGCGLCSLACDKVHAIRMEPVPQHQLPYRSWFSMVLQTAPSRLWQAWKVWQKYR